MLFDQNAHTHPRKASGFIVGGGEVLVCVVDLVDQGCDAGHYRTGCFGSSEGECLPCAECGALQFQVHIF